MMCAMLGYIALVAICAVVAGIISLAVMFAIGLIGRGGM